MLRGRKGEEKIQIPNQIWTPSRVLGQGCRMAGCVVAAQILDPGPWTLPGVGCKGLLGGDNVRLLTFPKKKKKINALF